MTTTISNLFPPDDSVLACGRETKESHLSYPLFLAIELPMVSAFFFFFFFFSSLFAVCTAVTLEEEGH